MTRFLTLCLLLMMAVLLAAPAPATAADRPPNIIFIIADDLGYGDLGCYGQKIIRTPNLDRMAAEGMRLTHHYSGNAVCAPSRSVLMTGLHPGHTYTRDNRSMEPEGQWPIPAEAVTIPELLKPLGYTTGGFGKWGLGGPNTSGEPLKQGIDRWYGYNCQGVAHNFYPTYLWDNADKVSLNNPEFSSKDKLRPDEDPNDPKSYDRFKGKAYSADLISEQAHKFIRDNKDRPFFLYWPTTVPHLALQVPDEALAEYAGKFDDPPYPGGKGYIPHFKPRAAYAAMITRMDAEIGKAMAIVKDLGLDENTIFVFVSDNGALNGTHQGLAGTDAAFFNSCGGLRDGKGSLYEGGIRVPGIVRWTGKVKPNQTSDHVTGFEDWMPTLLELAGAKDKAPKAIDGISFAPLLLGQKQPARPFLYREFPSYGGQQSVRIGNWKGIRTDLNPRPAAKKKAKADPTAKAPKIDLRIALYDLANDPAETKDVSADHPDIVAKMEAIMREQHTPSPDFPFPALDG
ncbi:MAG TPA: arylsulfatase [Prosthecobacter sp.]|nr:arylsulfatase [Prosthecobacter sp.]